MTLHRLIIVTAVAVRTGCDINKAADLRCNVRYHAGIWRVLWLPQKRDLKHKYTQMNADLAVQLSGVGRTCRPFKRACQSR